MRGHLKCTCHPDGTTTTEMILSFERRHTLLASSLDSTMLGPIYIRPPKQLDVETLFPSMGNRTGHNPGS